MARAGLTNKSAGIRQAENFATAGMHLSFREIDMHVSIRPNSEQASGPKPLKIARFILATGRG
jgi:hypothetical protein